MNHDKPQREPASFTVPSWLVVLIKVSWPAILLFAAMYVKIHLLGKDVDRLQDTRKILFQRVSEGDARQQTLKFDLTRVEMRQTGLDKDLRGVLDRIEARLERVDGTVRQMAITQTALKTRMEMFTKRVEKETP